MNNYGLGGIYQRNGRWHISYSNHGKQFRESTGILVGAEPAKSELKARRFLQKRLNEIAAHKFAPQQDKLTVEEVIGAFIERYRMEGRRSLETTVIVLKHVRRIFRGYRAIDVTGPKLRDYVNQRKSESAAPATIHRELGHLRTALRLAATDGRLTAIPPFPTIKVDNARQGFLEAANFERLRAELPPTLRDYATFLYLSGWRSNEARLLEWRDVDIEAGEIRLRSENSKTAVARTLPLFGELAEVIRRQHTERGLDSRFVFTRLDGRPIGGIRPTWKRCAIRAGLGPLTPHDCRRSTARNLIRAGISQHVAMAWTGHKTPSMFSRYDIISSDDLKLAAEKLSEYVEEQKLKPAKVVPIATSTKLARGARKAG